MAIKMDGAIRGAGRLGRPGVAWRLLPRECERERHQRERETVRESDTRERERQ